MPDQLGRRIAHLRSLYGWTQQELAERLAISRVAVSHLEAGISLPGERTVTLLAGLFKREPLELVADTSYPSAKAERLPLVACRYTESELQDRLLRCDLDWLERLRDHPGWRNLALAMCQRWFATLDTLERAAVDPREHVQVSTMRATIQALYGQALEAKHTT